MKELSPEWYEGYETGYMEGESSGYADWILAFNEDDELGELFPDGEIRGPADVLTILKEAMKCPTRGVRK